MLEFRIDWGAVDQPEAIEAPVRESAVLGLSIVTPQMRRNIASRTPTDLMRARRGWVSNVEVSRSAAVGTVSNPVPYISPLEFGSRPHHPPVDALRGWAERKLGDADLAWAMAKTIAKRGTKGHHMAERGFEASQQLIEITLTNAVRQGFNKLQ